MPYRAPSFVGLQQISDCNDATRDGAEVLPSIQACTKLNKINSCLSGG
jgi:hypothetical protein